jgi:hypothetical protein
LKREAFLPKGGKYQFSGINSRGPRNLSQKMRIGQILKKLMPNLKKLELNSTNLELNFKKTHPDCTKKPNPSIGYRLHAKN